MVGLEGLAAQQLLHGSNSLRSLTLSVVQNGTGHVAVGNFVLGSVQSVNTDEVDVLVDGTACSLNGLQSTDSHIIVVAENNFDLIAVLGKVVLADFLALVTVPVTALQVKLLNLNAGIGQSLDGVLGTQLSIDILGVALNHDVGNLAVAVDVALVLGVEDQLALEGAGLSSVAADVDQLVISGHLIGGGLTVDQDGGNIGTLDGGDDLVGSGGHNGVDDQCVNALRDEGVDLLVLLGLVVVAGDNGDLVALALEDFLQRITVGGHEGIVELVNADADLTALSGLGNALGCGLSSRLCSRGGLCGSRGLRSSGGSGGRTAAGGERDGHATCKGQSSKLFHNEFLLLF